MGVAANQFIFAVMMGGCLFAWGMTFEWRRHRKAGCPCDQCARWRERVMAEAKKKIGAEQ